MFSLLLVIIYISFISLGLPDAVIGASWPVMHLELGVPLSYAGLLTMVISCGTVVSSLCSDRLTKRFGVGGVTTASVLLTAAALLGFSFAGKVWMLFALAIPYGLGAGAVDSALNNFVAVHYSSRHMSWLHCFWGLGALLGPYILGLFLAGGRGWQYGYRAISVLQFILTAALFASLSVWKKVERPAADTPVAAPQPLRQVLRVPGAPLMMGASFAYCAMETTTGLWASSYLVEHGGVDSVTAARFASLFYIGITAGRFVSGFVADRIGDRSMIRMGLGVALGGILLVLLPTGVTVTALIGLVVIGIGCAPVYPSIIHATPANFGKENSQALVGVQMASAYIGSTVMPTVFGFVANHLTIALYPAYLLALCAVIIVMTERLNHRAKRA